MNHRTNKNKIKSKSRKKKTSPYGRFRAVDSTLQTITSTDPVLLCRLRWQKWGGGQRAQISNLLTAKSPSTQSPRVRFPLRALRFFGLPDLPAQPAFLPLRPSVLLYLLVVFCFLFSFNPCSLFGFSVAPGFFGGTSHLP